MIKTVNRNTFRKPEKICNQKQIDRLFKEGKSFYSGLFRLLFVESELSEQPPVQLLIAVPKKNLRHAVSRNRMKRLIREAYRLNKHALIEAHNKSGKHCDIAIIFTGKSCISQSHTLVAINVLLNRLKQTHEKNTE